ncbi:MAG: hypothetical protein ACLFV7_04980 [Phycisphaerae bacterium]
MHRRQALTAMALAVLAFCGVASSAGLEVTLTPADDADPNQRLQPAALTLENNTDATVASVSLRWDRGGPNFVYPLAVGPGGRASRTVFLPALWVDQQYTVTALDETHQPVASATAAVAWPASRVAPDALLAADLYGRYRYDLPQWDRQFRMNLAMVAGLAVLGLGGVALLHRTWVRLAGVALLVIVSTGAVSVMVMREPLVVERELPLQADEAGTSAASTRRVLVLTTRRTTDVLVSRSNLEPVYPSVDAMLADKAVIRPGGESELTLLPPSPRLLLIEP